MAYEDFFLMEADGWIGKLTFRPRINAKYLHTSGHIGYEIRPPKRQQGYGTMLLRLGWRKCENAGLTECSSPAMKITSAHAK